VFMTVLVLYQPEDVEHFERVTNAEVGVRWEEGMSCWWESRGSVQLRGWKRMRVWIG
jgi:hypothetical protein